MLKILAHRGPLHGYDITVRIQEVSKDVLRVEEGSLYPTLHRMGEARWIKAKWLTTENKRRAGVYEITADGRRQLNAEGKRWMAMNAAVVRALMHASEDLVSWLSRFLNVVRRDRVNKELTRRFGFIWQPERKN